MAEETYSVDCKYREENGYGGDYCQRFTDFHMGLENPLEVTGEICGGCRVAEALLEEGDEEDLSDWR